MLEELGLGEAPSAEDADVVVFNTCTIREKPDTKLAAHLGEAIARKRARPRARDRRRRLLRRGAARADLRALPGGRRRLRARLDRPPRRLARRRRDGRRPRPLRPRRARVRRRRCRCTASGRFQAWVQVSMGCNSVCSYCIVPAVRGREQSRRPGRGRRRGRRALAARRRPRADAARPERQLLRAATSRPRSATEFGELLRACDAVDGIERIRFTSPHPKDFREPVIAAIAECAGGLRARPPAAPVGLDPDPEGDAAHLHARALPRARRAAARRDPRPRARHRHHRRLSRARPRTTSRRRSSSSRRSASTAPSPSSTRRARAPRRRRCPTRSPHELKIERHGAARRADPAARRASATRARVGRVEEVLVEGPSRTDETAAARPHAPQHDGQLHRRGRSRASSSRSRSTGATSTTLRGRAGGARRASRRRRSGRVRRCASSSPAPRARSARTSRCGCSSDGHEVCGVDKRPNTWTTRRSSTLLQDLAGPLRALPRRHERRRVPRGRPRRPPRRPREGAPARAPAAARARERDDDLQRPRVLPRARPAARLLLDARGLRRRPPLRGVRRGDRRLRLHREPLLGLEDRLGGVHLLLREVLRPPLPRLPLLERLRALRQRPRSGWSG